MRAVLFVPRGLAVFWLVVALTWGASTVAGFSRGFTGFGQAANMVVAVVALWLAATYAVYRVTLDDDGVTVRTLRGRRHWDWLAVERLTLRQAGAAARLIVTARGAEHRYPGWSLRGRGDDGEVDDAALALREFGRRHRVTVKVVRLPGVGKPA